MAKRIDRCECGSYNLQVADSRNRDGLIYRARKCCDCGKRFKTIEISFSDFENLERYKEIIYHIKAIELVIEDKQKCEIAERKKTE